jgi:copper chaperone CopZ
MIHHSLQLASILDVAGVIKVMDALRAVPGVDAVEAVSGERVIEVRYDQHRTSEQEIGAVLVRAGHPTQPRRHAGGSCCGSCGG